MFLGTKVGKSMFQGSKISAAAGRGAHAMAKTMLAAETLLLLLAPRLWLPTLLLGPGLWLPTLLLAPWLRLPALLPAAPIPRLLTRPLPRLRGEPSPGIANFRCPVQTTR